MNLELVYEIDAPLSPALTEDEVHMIVSHVLERMHVERDCSVSISYVSNERITELNGEWRGIASPTDVLSFECDNPFDPDLPKNAPVALGDIVLAPEFIEIQAREYQTTFADEERLMIVHATLHLLGYDHEENEDARTMQALEDEILSEIETDGTLSSHVLTRHREEDLSDS